MWRLASGLMVAVVLSGQTLTYAPQDTVTKRVSLWAVTGCPGRPVSSTMIYALASQNGVPWMVPATAERMFRKRSLWGRLVRAAGFAAAGGGTLMTFDVVKASPGWQNALLIGGALITVLTPLAQREVPAVDPQVGLPLLVGPDGCGTTYFYAFPSTVGPFQGKL